jgi:hypothetical protein
MRTSWRFVGAVIKIANITNDLIHLMCFAVLPIPIVNAKQLIIDIHRTRVSEQKKQHYQDQDQE